MAFNTHRKFARITRKAWYFPVETLPIPYTLTDFGRAYLQQQRAMEAAEELAGAVQPDSGSPEPRQVQCHSR